MKLGEVLISDGVITANQLKDALDAQLIYGGHLGTCLIELGCLDEARLGQALSRTFGVSYAPLEAFLDIPRVVVNALPQKIVQKHSAVPFRFRDKVLDVAMIDPKNLQAIDEIRFASGYAIQSFIAPEVRIFQAMERYYDVPRRIRYVQLCRTLDKDRPASWGAEASGFDHLEGGRAAEVAAVASRVTAPSAVRAVDPLLAVATLLCAAKTEDQIADLVLDAMNGDVPRRVLFKVRGNSAYVWRSAGAQFDLAVANVRFPILSESIFALLHGDDYYAGPLPPDPVHHGFFRKLGIERPARILLLPVHFDDQLIALFYGDGGCTGAIGLDIERHRRLLAKAALAINIVQTRMKIHAI